MMWLKRAGQEGNCFRCSEKYEKKDIIGIIALKTTQGIVHHFYHPPCWLATGMEALGKRGEDREYGEITEEQFRDRQLVLHHWAQLNYREKLFREKYEGEKLRKLLRNVEHSRDNLRMRMVSLGGVPRSWEKE